MEVEKVIYSGSTWVIPILIAITFHEAAHAYAAWRLGDDTALRAGRVTFNPLKHLDAFGTIVVPALLLVAGSPFLFGWAKPVPVAFDRLTRPRCDMALVAVAGPLTNVMLAFASAMLLHLAWLAPEPTSRWLAQTLYQSLVLNLVLAIFNLLPIPPLDGSRILLSVMPGVLARPYAKLERFGLLILLGLVFVVPMAARQFGVDLNVVRWLVGLPVAYLTKMVLLLVGHVR